MISIRHVKKSFSQNVILEDINLDIPKGSSTVIIGGSGCGKSTLAQLILREFEPQSGKISFNGIDISLFNLRQWREITGYVPQQPQIFNTSILENITLGNNPPDTQKVLQICSSLGLDSLIGRSSEGILTCVGENGNRLSGGECQKIGIARALYKNPQIYILDEATSSLDKKSEKIVAECIHRLRDSGKTIIMISHKKESAIIADNVVQLNRTGSKW